MTKQVQRRRGTTTQHTSFTGAEGEISVNTSNKTIHVHDGSTAGGFQSALANLDNVAVADVSSALAGVTNIDINGGTIDGTVIGGNSAAAITGTTVTGTSFVSSGNMTFGDDDKAIFGAGSDLQIYHDASNSYIRENGTGDLLIQATNIQLEDPDGNNYLRGVDGGAVQIYHSGDQKFVTTSTGIDVTGTVTADGLTVDGGSTSTIRITGQGQSSNEFSILEFYNTDGSNDGPQVTGKISMTGNASGVNSSLNLYTAKSDTGVEGAAPTKRMTIAANGNVSFYEDTGTTPKFFWDASAQSLNVDGPITSEGLTVDGSLGDFQVSTGGNQLSLTYNGNNYINTTGDGSALNFRMTSAYTQAMKINSNNDISFYEDTGTTPKFFWDASTERLGLGVAAPSAPLQIVSTVGSSIPALGAASSHAAIGSSGFGTMIGTQNTGAGYIQQQRFDGAATAYNLLLQPNGGNVGIGTTLPEALLDLAYNLPDDTNGIIRPLKVRTTDLTNQTNLLAGDGVGILFEIASNPVGGETSLIGASIDAVKEADSDTNSSTRLSFKTSPNNETLTEAMRITSKGSILVQTSTEIAALAVASTTAVAYTANFTGQPANGYNLVLRANAGITGGTAVRIQNAAGAEVGTITYSATATAYITSSDYRLKTDAQPMTGASARVQALNPVNFEWIADGTRVDGFLAHEAATVVPESVSGTKDAMVDEEYEVTPAVLDDDGNETTAAVMGTHSVPKYQGIDQSKLVPLLTAALQEALTKIDDLEARLTALEG